MEGKVMVKILFVDDEVLAMEYLQSLVEWEKYGYEVVGHALNGKKASEIFDKEKPQIVISDIKMVGMDGLELAKQLKERNPDVFVILLSAYRDFEYAQKGIQYGVDNYLLKHELCEEKLLEELGKISEKLESEEKKQKIYHKYFVRQLIYNHEKITEEEKKNFGNRFFMLLLQKNSLFQNGVFIEQRWTEQEINRMISVAESMTDEIKYLSEEHLNEAHEILLFKISDINSKYIVTKEIERVCRKITDSLTETGNYNFNVIYSNEIRREEISGIFQKMSWLIRYSVFWKPGKMYELNRLIEPEEALKIDWNEKEKELKEIIYKDKKHLEDYLEYLFELVQFPAQDLHALRELVYVLENLMRQIENQESVNQERNQIFLGKLMEIQKYYGNCFGQVSEQIAEKENQKYSGIVISIMHYINKNFDKELNLEILGKEFNMNGVYLGQIFKKETGSTFLKYLTNCRIEKAKILLQNRNRSIAEVSEMVGYKSSQYFSQIFVKNTGTTPQEYRKWNGKQ